MSYAGILIEEYRADRALCSHGQRGAERDLGDFDSDLAALAAECAEAWSRVEANETGMDAFTAAVQTAFFQMI
jgi:hypothetical protein